MRSALPFTLALAACAGASRPGPDPAALRTGYGILLMAHGGTPEWNRSVARAAVEAPVGAPVVTAFGMAERATLESALDSLGSLGVERVAVVRLFLSGSSFRERTERLLGISAGGAAPVAGAGMPISRRLSLATHTEGLMTSPQLGEILADRVASVSLDPARESVLVLAHGMGDDAEDAQVVASMRAAAVAIEAEGFARVEVATLREDWPAKRQAAEAQVRSFVSSETAIGHRVLVVPFRLEGFGPYATVLDGLTYTPTRALLPHPAIPRWIARIGRQIACRERWLAPGACAE